MRTGQWDGVSASGNASAKLVDGGDVAPVNTDLVPNYKTIFDDLKNQPYNTFDGKPLRDSARPRGEPLDVELERRQAGSDVVVDHARSRQAAKYKGKISVYDDPIYIADAAVYLKAHQPDLGITNPYELDDDQFNAAVDLLKQQHPNVGEYWSDAAKQINSFANGDDVVGTTWQYQYFALLADKPPMKAPGPSTGFLPTEGATGWSDTWMIAKNAAHPNCMYKWMNFIASPKANAEVAQYFGEAPAQSKACDPSTLTAAAKADGLPADPQFCDEYHAADPNFWKRVYYWQVPVADCGDNRGDTARTTTTGPPPGPRSRGDRRIEITRDECHGSGRRSAGRRRGRRAAGSPTSSMAAPGSRWGRCWPARSAGW